MKNIVLTSSLLAADTIGQVFQKIRPDRDTDVTAFLDDFSHGPLPRGATSADFFKARQKYWKTYDLHVTDIFYKTNELDYYRAMVDQITSANRVEIWIAESVQDVFFTAVILHLLESDGVEISGIAIRQFTGHIFRWGIAVAKVEQLETAYLSTAALPCDAKLFSNVWAAISEGSSDAIRAMISSIDPNSSLSKALQSYLLRFPECNGGLGALERRLLGAGTDQVRSAAHTVGYAMAKEEPEYDHIGDLVLFGRLVELCKVTPDPWFRLQGDPREMRLCSVQLTEHGKTAIAEYSVVSLLGK